MGHRRQGPEARLGARLPGVGRGRLRARSGRIRAALLRAPGRRGSAGPIHGEAEVPGPTDLAGWFSTNQPRKCVLSPANTAPLSAIVTAPSLIEASPESTSLHRVPP